MLKHIFQFCVLLILIYGCASSPRYTSFASNTTTSAQKSTSTTTSRSSHQNGKASFYGRKFHGRQTANGEIYNMHDMTAAHKELPFNTMVKVTNLENNRTVTVRINDRGPFVRGRIIDLSYGAAKKIDMIDDGVVPVKIEILE
ncbi:septal ring lytic transglycosylase RlpA family protein [Chitinispirillales bacterium ANBcel5]|uniref:septal ring lytic transglycosylase RlpA family protein n=1 Tax=Cellulosispirillum alkaliphilum TaxID=3039283 RepID=UPI002A58A5F3|nr:septal ring lytic transglycosylase RlpA family protein [Chitinispirillales bacterium ANBcel5]